MAKIKTDSDEVELEDNSPIRPACEQLGVPFACGEGICGTCKIKVLEGMENLSEKNDKENQYALQEGERLACQCTIKSGEVKISF